MSETSVPRDAGRDEDPSGLPAGPGDHPSLGSPDWQLVPCRPDWDEAYLAALGDDEDPGDLDLYEDPDNAPPAGLDDAELAALIAEAREITAAQARAAAAAARLGNTAVLAAVAAEVTGRRGPGMPAPRSGSPAGPRARPPGSRPANRWMSRRAAPRWPRSWRAAPGTRTGTRAPATMSCSG